MNKKRVLSLVIVLILFLSGSAFGIYKYDRQRKLPFGEKNTFAMNTIVSQKVYADFGAKHIEKGNLIINALEDTISRHIPSSAVSILNEKGVAEDSETAEIIRQCKEITALSGGAFDITVGKVVDLWNFDGENENIPDEKELKKELSFVGAEKLETGGDKITLSSEAAVDLGAVGKGVACDKLISLYRQVKDCNGAIVAVGGSVGCFGSYNKAGDSWKIGIRHPRQENGFLGVLKLKEGFVSTSGDYEKYFIKDGERYHHILDARTGRPASSGLISVTVICKSGFLSDALSTACFILGEEEGTRLVEKYDASAIFVDEKLNITTVGEVDFEGC